MEDKENTQVKRLYVSLLNHTDEKTAYDIACGIKLPKNPSDKKPIFTEKMIMKISL